MSDMIKREDIKLAPKGRQCKIDRCELFNRLATITADDANDMKAKIYAVIQEMPAMPERVIQPVHVHIDAEEIMEKIMEKIREEYELTDDIVRCGDCKHRKKNGFCLEHNRYEKNDSGYCSYGEREGSE